MAMTLDEYTKRFPDRNQQSETKPWRAAVNVPSFRKCRERRSWAKHEIPLHGVQEGFLEYFTAVFDGETYLLDLTANSQMPRLAGDP
jgi:hypothetical protein